MANLEHLKQIEILKKILLFVLLNSSIYLAIQTTAPNGPIRMVIIVLMLSSVYLLIRSFLKMRKTEFDTNYYFKILFTLLIGWSIFTIFRSFSPNPKTLITLFGHLFMGWTWMVPLIVVFGFNIRNWLEIFDFIGKILLGGSILGFGVVFYSMPTIFGVLEWMTFLPILLITYFYQSKKNKQIVLFSILMFLVLTIFASQRTNFLFLGLMLLGVLIEFYRQSEVSIFKKVVVFYVVVIAGLLFAYQAENIYNDLANDDDVTSDTRTFLFEELYADMDETDLLLGRGALGTYYSPYFAGLIKGGIEGGDSPTRSASEVGYLHIILKGGYVMMALYLLILLPAAFLGIFRSNNIISRMSGYYILAHLILWMVSYGPMYSPKFILLWMAAGSAISTSGRKMKNSDLLVNNNGRIEFAKE